MDKQPDTRHRSLTASEQCWLREAEKYLALAEAAKTDEAREYWKQQAQARLDLIG